MDKAEALQCLLAALRERDIPLTRNDVQWAFDSPKTSTEIIRYVQQHLGPDTLLSGEELTLYKKLESNGTVRNITANQDISSVVPILDNDLKSAIASLESSTAAIQQHNDELRAQHDVIKALLQQKDQDDSVRKKAVQRQQRKYALEKQQVASAADEIALNLESQLSLWQGNAKVGPEMLRSTIRDLLRDDDKLLARLQSLIGEAAKSGSDEGEAVRDRALSLGSRLAVFQAEAIRERLDRVFIESLEKAGAAKGANGQSSTSQAETEALQEELESLYSEIDSVAEMASLQEYVHPLSRQLDMKKSRGQETRASILNYVRNFPGNLLAFTDDFQTQDYLAHLTQRLQIITERSEEHSEYQRAVKVVSEDIRDELSKSIRAAPASPSKTRSPVRRRLSSTLMKSPKRTVRTPRQDSPSVSLDDVPPEQQLLRMLAVSLPEDEDMDAAIASTVRSRQLKYVQQLMSTESSIEDSLAVHVGDADRIVRLLLEVLHADSPDGDIRMLNKELEIGMKRFEEGLGNVGKEMSALHPEVLQQRDKAREVFIQRWSSGQHTPRVN
ncbi:MAG: hypothetical protein M1824_005945 [Vezdaea acicularis]|nr:MAG: hypothetical protein M1824_005945 [Vezdaea acicularis]